MIDLKFKRDDDGDAFHEYQPDARLFPFYVPEYDSPEVRANLWPGYMEMVERENRCCQRCCQSRRSKFLRILNHARKRLYRLLTMRKKLFGWGRA